MTQQGSTNRRTLEEMLLGIELPEESELDADGWVETQYIWDVTLPYGQLLTETTGESTTSYLYGLERISGTTSGNKTQYLYDGRGSVAQTLTTMAGSATTTAKSYAYTPFGSPLDEQSRVTGFGYNAEYYDAATGMLNLRARQYEPQMNRFSQKDVLKGSQWLPQSLNRYAFVMNDPVSYADPSGMSMTLTMILVGKAAVPIVLKVAAVAVPFVGLGLMMAPAPYIAYDKRALTTQYSQKDTPTYWVLNPFPTCIIVNTNTTDETGGAGTGASGSPTNNGTNNKKDKDNKKLSGENGSRTTSTTTSKGTKGKERIDVENPNPGVRPGNLHMHDANNTKWRYDTFKNIFVDPKTGATAPNSIQKLLNLPWVKKGIKKGLEILGGY